MITDLVTKPRKKTEIYFDKEFLGVLSKDSIYMAGLFVGQQLEKSKLVRIIAEYEKKDATSDLLAMVARSNMTERQAQEKLYKKEYSKDSVNFALQKVKGYGYINDIEFAKNYIEQNISRYGKLKIRQTLRQKLLEDSLIEELLQEIEEADSCKMMLEAMLRSKNTDLKDYKEKTKIIRALLYRGYEYSTIKDAISEYKRNNY